MLGVDLTGPPQGYHAHMAGDGIRFPCPDCGTELNLDISIYVSAADGTTGSVQAEIGDVPARVFDALIDQELDDDEDY